MPCSTRSLSGSQVMPTGNTWPSVCVHGTLKSWSSQITAIGGEGRRQCSVSDCTKSSLLVHQEQGWDADALCEPIRGIQNTVASSSPAKNSFPTVSASRARIGELGVMS